MIKLAARLVERLGSAVQNSRLDGLSDEERRGVLSLLNAVALADGVISPEEQAAIQRAEAKLGVASKLTLPEAIAVLAKKPAALKLACLVVADAFFVDGDYDLQEKAFVESFSARYQLPQNPLKEAVLMLRKKKLDAALRDWNQEISG